MQGCVVKEEATQTQTVEPLRSWAQFRDNPPQTWEFGNIYNPCNVGPQNTDGEWQWLQREDLVRPQTNVKDADPGNVTGKPQSNSR